MDSSNELALMDIDTAGFRCLALGSLAQRFDIEVFSQETGITKSEWTNLSKKINKIQIAINKGGITDHLSDNERILINKPLGTWGDDDWTYASFLNEKIGSILWAVSSIEEWPPADKQFDQNKVEVFFPYINSPDQFLHKLAYRSRGKIHQAWNLTTSYLWRARTRRAGDDLITLADGRKMPDIIAQNGRELKKHGLIPDLIENDLPAFGISFSKTTKDQVGLIGAINESRLWGLNWLSGCFEDWDHPILDT